MHTTHAQAIAAKKPFKLQANKYYLDHKSRIYGPMIKRTTLGAVVFSAPGHGYRWTENGDVMGIVWFSRAPNPCNLILKFNPRKHKKKMSKEYA